MGMTIQMTKLQRELLAYLAHAIEVEGVSPSLDLLAAHFHTSKSTIVRRKHNLFRRGYIEIHGHYASTVTITASGKQVWMHGEQPLPVVEKPPKKPRVHSPETRQKIAMSARQSWEDRQEKQIEAEKVNQRQIILEHDPEEVSIPQPQTPEEAARAYIFSKLVTVHGPNKPRSNTPIGTAIDPRVVCNLTGWPTTKVRRFILQVQDEWRESRSTHCKSLRAGVKNLLEAIYVTEEEEEEDD